MYMYTYIYTHVYTCVPACTYTLCIVAVLYVQIFSSDASAVAIVTHVLRITERKTDDLLLFPQIRFTLSATLAGRRALSLSLSPFLSLSLSLSLFLSRSLIATDILLAAPLPRVAPVMVEEKLALYIGV